MISFIHHHKDKIIVAQIAVLNIQTIYDITNTILYIYMINFFIDI